MKQLGYRVGAGVAWMWGWGPCGRPRCPEHSHFLPLMSNDLLQIFSLPGGPLQLPVAQRRQDHRHCAG